MGLKYYCISCDESYLSIGQKEESMEAFEEMKHFRGMKEEQTKSYLTAEEAILTEEAIQLKKHVLFEEEGLSLFAEQARGTFEDFEFKGHVRLISRRIWNRDSFGIADTLLYRHKEKTMTL